MTVLHEPVADIAGADDQTVFVFRSLIVRESDDGTGLITTNIATVQAVGGMLTTPDFDPGPAMVRIGPLAFHIEIPDSPTPIRLWPLVLAGLPIPVTQEADAVRNGGGVAVIKRLTQAEYNDLPSIDPMTFYVVVT